MSNYIQALLHQGRVRPTTMRSAFENSEVSLVTPVVKKVMAKLKAPAGYMMSTKDGWKPFRRARRQRG